LGKLSELLRCRNNELEQRVQSLMDDRKELEKKIKQVQKTSASSELDSIIRQAVDVSGIRVFTQVVTVDSVDELRMMGDRLRDGLKTNGIGVLGAVMGKKINFLCIITDDVIRERKIKAGDVVQRVAKIIGGSGGGKPHLALAGGKDNGNIQQALDRVPRIIEALMATG
jgi:alanyl-tRNA synthetase